MPRESPYPIILTEDEAQRLQRMAGQYTSPYCDVVRAKIVLLAATGMRNDDIGARLDLSRQIVSKWRQRFFYERLDGLHDRARSGKPCRQSIRGTWVDLPEPVGACRISRRCSRSLARISRSLSNIGKRDGAEGALTGPSALP